MIKKKKKFKYVYIALIFLLLCLFWYLLSNRSNITKFEKIIKDSAYFFSNLKDDYKYQIDLSLSNEKDKKINELSSLLNIKNNLSDFSIIYASVINKNVNDFLNILTINKGESSNITPDMAVITNNGLIGVTTIISNNYSNVKLLTNLSSNYQISVKINDVVPIYGILNEYLDDGTYLMTGIPLQDTITIGKDVVTTGLGSIYPEGIYIGKVKSVFKSSDGISNSVIIENNINFNDIRYVAVLERELS